MACRRASLLALLLVGAAVLPLTPAGGTDTVPPRAVDWGPRGVDVPTGTQVLIAWSERMNDSSVETAFSYSDGVLAYSAGRWTHDADRNTSVFSPATPFAPAVHYTVRVESTAHDLAGNRLDQNNDGVGGGPCSGPVSSWDCLVWSFDTAPPPPDTTAPRVLSTWPGDGAVAATNATIRIAFSETMDTASVEASFSYGDGVSLYTIAHGTATWTASSQPDDTLWFDPRLEFPAGGAVAVALSNGVARDLAGNVLDGDGDGAPGGLYNWSFSVLPDPIPPRVLGSAPVEGSTSVSISTTIRIAFSKSMAYASEWAVRLETPAGPNYTRSDGVATWSGTRFPADTLSFRPVGNLRTASPYVLTLNASGALDLEGLLLDGNGNGTAEGSPRDDYRLAFTTELEDRTSPTVVDRRPAVEAMDVPPSTNIIVWFSEPMNVSSVAAGFSYADGATTFRATDGTYFWNGATNAFMFTPAQSLRYGTLYAVTLEGATARDLAGNPLDGGANETWSFRTAGQADTTPPSMLWSSPFDGQRNVSLNARISFIFSEPMNKASVRGAMGITGGAGLTDFRWPNDAAVDAAISGSVSYRMSYLVFLLTSAKDLAGNSLAQPVQIAFTMESWRGRVTGRVVDAGGAGVPEARVQLDGLSVLTNATGGFAFEAVEQGAYTMTVSHPGFDSYTATVLIEPLQGPLPAVTLRQTAPPAVDATIWAATGAALLFVLVLIVFLRRRRPKPTAHYETWKPAKVVTVEPGQVHQRERE